MTAGTPPKILMVDDKPANLLALRRLLRNLPVELHEATSGNDALKLSLHHDFALALLDIQMPEMDGYELAELLRQEEKTAHLPFIFISAIYTEHINIFQGYEKGAFSYIVKPFEPEILLNKVQLFIEMHQQQQALHRRTLDLQQSNQELEAFCYAVSHDLRAPLRAIDGFSQALRDDCGSQLNDEGKDYLERICQAACRMGDLIDDLLDLSRVTRSDIRLADLDLAKLAGEVAENLNRQGPDSDVKIMISEPLFARGDARLLRIALENLLGNARKFCAGKANSKVSIGQINDNDSAIYYVRDNGVGFSMEYAGKLFSPFQRLHSGSEFPGTGIGLATVQRIIQKHGGRIWAEAEVDEGATFYFTLPVMNAESLKIQNEPQGERYE